jgi:hypothetical protein
VGAAGVDALRRHLENPDGTAPHPITTPAEHHGVDSPGQDSPEQHFSLTLVEDEAKDEVHQPNDCIRNSPTNRGNPS